MSGSALDPHRLRLREYQVYPCRRSRSWRVLRDPRVRSVSGADLQNSKRSLDAVLWFLGAAPVRKGSWSCRCALRSRIASFAVSSMREHHPFRSSAAMACVPLWFLYFGYFGGFGSAGLHILVIQVTGVALTPFPSFGQRKNKVPPSHKIQHQN